jgi:hypothetical protein
MSKLEVGRASEGSSKWSLELKSQLTAHSQNSITGQYGQCFDHQANLSHQGSGHGSTSGLNIVTD